MAKRKVITMLTVDWSVRSVTTATTVVFTNEL